MNLLESKFVTVFNAAVLRRTSLLERSFVRKVKTNVCLPKKARQSSPFFSPTRGSSSSRVLFRRHVDIQFGCWGYQLCVDIICSVSVIAVMAINSLLDRFLDI